MEDDIQKDLTKRAIEEVYDLKEGKFIDSKEFFSRPISEIMAYRKYLEEAIRLNEPRFVCSHCRQMVKLSGKSTQKGQVSFFSHLYDSDYCDIKTTTKMSKEEIEARKYGMIGESQRHRDLKDFISTYLQTDESKTIGISDVFVSKRIKSDIPYLNWRCPDVVAEYKGKKIVFELQLSTTFLSVIVDRDIFYRLNNYYVIWVFNFDNEKNKLDLGNLLAKDIYYANKRNVFILDEKAMQKSREEGKLYLSVTWLDASDKFVDTQLVSLDQLSFDDNNCKPFFFDADEIYYKNHPEELQRVSDLERSREEVLNALMLKQKYEEEKAQRIDEAIKRKREEMRQTGGVVTPYEKGKKWGYEYNGTKLTLPIYTSAGAINSQGIAVVTRNRKQGLVNQYGEEFFPCQYNSVLPLTNHQIIIHNDGKWSLHENQKVIAKSKKGDILTIKTLTERFVAITIKREDEYEADVIAIIDKDGRILDIKSVTDLDGRIAVVTQKGAWRWGRYGKYWKDYEKYNLEYPKQYLTFNGYFIDENDYNTENDFIIARNFDGDVGLIDKEFNPATPFIFYYMKAIDGKNWIVNRKGMYGVIRQNPETGRFVWRVPNKFNEIKDGSNGFLKVSIHFTWGVINPLNKMIIPIRYQNIGEITQDYIEVEKDNRWGKCDHSGNVIVEDIKYFGPNLKIGRRFERYGLTDDNGNILLDYNYHKIEIVNNMCIKADQSLFTLSGKQLYKEIIDVQPMKEGYVKVCARKKWGVIGPDCKVVIPLKYQSIGEISSNQIQVQKDNLWGVCTLSGKEIVEDLQFLGANLLIGKIFEKYGLTDVKGKTVLPYEYDNIELIGSYCIKADNDLFTLNGKLLQSNVNEVQTLENGIIICKSYNQIYIYDSSLCRLLEQYCIKTISEFHDGKAEIVLTNGKFGMITDAGEICEDMSEPLFNGMTKNRILESWGIKDACGKWLYPATFKSIIKLSKHIILNSENSFSILNEQGDLINNVNGVNFVSQVNEDLLKVYSHSKYGLCDFKGVIRTECKFDDIDTTSSNYLLTRLDEGGYRDYYQYYGLLKPDGETAIECDNRKVEIQGNYIHVLNRGIFMIYNFELMKLGEFYKVKQLSKEYFLVSDKRFGNNWGVVNSSWVSVIPCRYDEIKMLSDSWFALKQNGKWGCISSDLSQSFPCKYPNICLNEDLQPSVRISNDVIILCSNFTGIPKLEVGKIYKGEIYEVRKYGLMIKVESYKSLLHISEIHKHGKNLTDFAVGESIEVRVASYDDIKNRYSLSL